MMIVKTFFKCTLFYVLYLQLGMGNLGYANEPKTSKINSGVKNQDQKEVKINKYMDNNVYYKMLENDFVEMFTRVDSWKDYMKPYIIKHKKNYYILKDPDRSNFSKIRVWFQNKKLIKLEVLGWEGYPIFREAYDCTHYLKFYEIEDSLYVGMSRNEFLIRFVDRIVGKVSEDYYAIEAKGGGYRTVSFEDDLLIHAPIIGPEDWKGWQKYLIKLN